MEKNAIGPNNETPEKTSQQGVCFLAGSTHTHKNEPSVCLVFCFIASREAFIHEHIKFINKVLLCSHNQVSGGIVVVNTKLYYVVFT